MITLIYRGIIAVVLIFTIWNLFDEEKITLQANAALVVIPLILRLLMIKYGGRHEEKSYNSGCLPCGSAGCDRGDRIKFCVTLRSGRD